MTRIHGLDALRGMAAIVVLFMHVFGFAAGHLAVDFFFMLSGFVMTRTYEARLCDGTIKPVAFFARRYRRLWGAMAAGSALGLAVHLASGGEFMTAIVAFGFALLLVPASASVPYLLNLPAWSIFYELVANGLHGLVLARLRTSWLALLALALAAGFVAMVMIHGFPRILSVTSAGMQLMVLLRAVLGYVLGVLLYRLCKERPPFAIPVGWGLTALPAYALIVALYPFNLWPLPFIFIIAPLMILSGLDPKAPARLSTWLGDLSFPLYALHVPIIQFVALIGGGAGMAITLSLLAAIGWTLAVRTRAQPSGTPVTAPEPTGLPARSA